MSILFLNRFSFSQWLLKIRESYIVYLPEILEDKVHYNKISVDDTFDKIASEVLIYQALEKIRVAEPLKGFFFNPRVKVGGLTKKTKLDIRHDTTPRLIIGAKSCDLRPLMVHQKMYLESDFGDSFYKTQFDRTVIIAADCPTPAETCFCNLLGLKPYPEKGADINLSVVSNGYVFEPVSKKGEEFLRNHNHLFQQASSENIEERDEKRKQAIAKLAQINPQQLHNELPKLIDEKTESNFWQEHADKCVECFGCLMVCPTCFCFLLYDAPEQKDTFERYKIWDACYYAAYARVGGGMQDRAEFWKRFRNRFHCKFMHFKNKYDFFACSGCGRCYSVCMGKIDIRKILEKV